jgi:hypothetical protein
MTLAQIDVGNTINDGTGDDLRSAFIKINQNFQTLDNVALSAINLGTAGAEVYAENVNGVATYRKLVAGTSVVLEQLENTIVINATPDDSRFVVTGDTSSLIAGNGINLNIQGANGIVVGAEENSSTITITGGVAVLTETLDADSNTIDNVGTLTAANMVPTNINGFDYNTIIGRYVEGFDFGTFNVNSSSILDWVIRQVGVDMGTFTAPNTMLVDLGNIL